jgi:ubiquinone/menaquinone biosynthesis C-methylase UbiE/DNA-binding transcriptional ArsR family regulator
MNTTLRAGVFDQLTTLSDPTRSRLLHILQGRELTVTELCSVLQLPQSTVSRHLKILSDDGWVSSRADGTSRYYRLETALEPAAEQLWTIVRDQVAETSAGREDVRRVERVVSERRSRSQEFFSSVAGQWDSVRHDLFGDRSPLVGMMALVDPDAVVADLGCGTGSLTATLAPFVRRVIAVDASVSMLAAAQARLDGATNVEIRQGELELVPIESAQMDAAVMSLVLHYIAEPVKALGEAARVLRPGGRLVMVDMMPHDRDEYRQQMGHVWQGFSPEQMADWLSAAGFERVRYVSLPVAPDAKGPALFVASASRPVTPSAVVIPRSDN